MVDVDLLADAANVYTLDNPSNLDTYPFLLHLSKRIALEEACFLSVLPVFQLVP